VGVHTQAIMMSGMNTLGRRRLSMTLVNGSKTEYETKKMVRVALYWAFVMPRSVWRPTSFALPIFVLNEMGLVSLGTGRCVCLSYRSRNETRYSRLSHGTRRRSSFQSSLRSCYCVLVSFGRNNMFIDKECSRNAQSPPFPPHSALHLDPQIQPQQADP
jgi:hypothetical protein